MRRMKLVLAGVISLSLLVGLQISAQEKSPEDDMQKKLTYSKNILDGLVTEDFDKIIVKADWLRHSADGSLRADRATVTTCTYDDPHLHVTTGDLRGVESFDAFGELRWRAEYNRWQDVPGGRYPFEVVLHFPLTQLRAELELDTVELNPELDASLFRLGGGGPE